MRRIITDDVEIVHIRALDEGVLRIPRSTSPNQGLLVQIHESILLSKIDKDMQSSMIEF